MATKRRAWHPARFLPVLVLGLIAAPSRAQDAPEAAAARWADARKTAVYLEVSQPGRIMEQLEGDRVQGLAQAIPALGKALDSQQMRELKGVVEYLSSALETSPREALGRVLGGRLSLVIEGEKQAFLVIEPKDADFLEKAHDKLVELARADAKTKGKPDPVKEAEYKGVTGYSVSEGEVHAIIDGSLYVAAGNEMMKTLIDRMKDGTGDLEILSENPLWKERQAAASQTAAWALVRIDRLRELDPKSYDPMKVDTGAQFLFGPWISSLQKADWAGAQLDWTGSHLELNVMVPHVDEVYTDAVAGYVPPTGEGAAPPIEVPGLIASASLWRDMSAIWEARGELFPPEAQNGFAQLDTLAGTFFGGRDFGTDVLGALGKNWHLVVASQDPATLDPRPDLLLPAFALVIRVNPEDAEFNNRLKAAFQSFIGLANLGAAQEKAPPLMLGSVEVDGSTISTAKYLKPKDAPEGEPVHQRFNFSPSAVQVADRFVISSSASLAGELVKALKAEESGASASAQPATFLVTASGSQLAKLVEANRERLIANNMVEEGNDRAAAETQIAILQTVIDYLGKGQLRISDTQEALRAVLSFDLDQD